MRGEVFGSSPATSPYFSIPKMLRLAGSIAVVRAPTKIMSTPAARPAPRQVTRKYAVEGVPSFHEREKTLEDEAVRRHEKELKGDQKKKAEEGKFP
jgi:hypothetical protein